MIKGRKGRDIGFDRGIDIENKKKRERGKKEGDRAKWR